MDSNHDFQWLYQLQGKRLAGMTHNKIIDLLKTSCLSEKVVLVCTRPHESNKNEMNDDHSSLPSLRSYHGESIETSKSSTTIESSSNKDANNNNNFKMIQADITKDVTGLGFMIEGGKNSSFGDLPISIKRIYRGTKKSWNSFMTWFWIFFNSQSTGGAIDKEGTLMEGDELLFVNNHPMEKMTKSDAWNFLKQLPDGLVLMVVRRKMFLW